MMTKSTMARIKRTIKIAILSMAVMASTSTGNVAKPVIIVKAASAVHTIK